MTTSNPSRSAIEDLFQVFENNPEFITKGKRLLNKKRKLEQLRAQLNMPEQLTSEDRIKLFELRERLRAKRRLRERITAVPNVQKQRFFSVHLATVSIESEAFAKNNESTGIRRKPSTSMPDLTKAALSVLYLAKELNNLRFLSFSLSSRADTTNRSSFFDLNASLNSSVYRKRRRKSLFRVNKKLLIKLNCIFGRLPSLWDWMNSGSFWDVKDRIVSAFRCIIFVRIPIDVLLRQRRIFYFSHRSVDTWSFFSHLDEKNEDASIGHVHRPGLLAANEEIDGWWVRWLLREYDPRRARMFSSCSSIAWLCILVDNRKKFGSLAERLISFFCFLSK